MPKKSTKKTDDARRKGGSGTPRKPVDAKPAKKLSTRATLTSNAEAEKKISAFLKKKPDQKRADIATGTGLDGTTVKAALVRMARRDPPEISADGATVTRTYSLAS